MKQCFKIHQCGFILGIVTECIFRLSVSRDNILTLLCDTVRPISKIKSKLRRHEETPLPVEVQIRFNRTKSLFGSAVNTLRGELFADRRVKVPSIYSSGAASTFWRSEFPGFSRIFRKLEVKATNCRAFHSSIHGELDGATVTQRVEPTAAAKTSKSSYNRTVARTERRDGGWTGEQARREK